MAPSKGTTVRTVRIDEALWSAASKKAAAAGESVSAVIRRALEEYVSAS